MKMTNTQNGKKILRVTAFVMTAIMLAALLTSCGGLSGKYTNDTLGLSFEFKSGGKVIITYPNITLTGIKSTTSEGTYELNKDKTKITMTFGDEDAKSYGGESEFEMGKDYIKVDGLTFTKDKK